MGGFVKLDCGITDSSLWFEPPATRVVFITLLTKCDPSGFARCVRQAWERDSNVGHDDFERAVNCLESPDSNSRDSSNEGRRIQKIEGGWKVLNYQKWRQFLYSESYEAQKKRRQRAAHVPICPDMSQNVSGHSASAYASTSSVQGEGVEGGKVICLFKKLQQELNGMFGRKPEAHWTNYEETNLLEITRTGTAETELQELKAYRGLNGKYFPKSVKSLLENWQTTLDQSRTYQKPQDQKTPEDRRWEREMERNKRDIERMGLAE